MTATPPYSLVTGESPALGVTRSTSPLRLNEDEYEALHDRLCACGTPASALSMAAGAHPDDVHAAFGTWDGPSRSGDVAA